MELPSDPAPGVPQDEVDTHRYQLALEAGRMGTWFWDSALDRLDWDEQLMHVFGVTADTFEGTFAAYLALLHEDDVAATVATVEESLRTGRDHYVEHRVVLPDGGVRWVSGTGRVLTDDNGAVTGMVGVGADITEQHAQQDARLAAEAATEIARSAAAAAESRLALLGRISGVLGGSLDVLTTMQQVADLVVQERLADWCVVELPGDERTSDQMAVAHRDPEMVAMAYRARREYPPERRDDRGLGKVMRTGQPELWPSIPAELLVQTARDEGHRQLLQDLQLSAAMIVPLVGRGEVLGAVMMHGVRRAEASSPDTTVVPRHPPRRFRSGRRPHGVGPLETPLWCVPRRARQVPLPGARPRKPHPLPSSAAVAGVGSSPHRYPQRWTRGVRCGAPCTRSTTSCSRRCATTPWRMPRRRRYDGWPWSRTRPSSRARSGAT